MSPARQPAFEVLLCVRALDGTVVTRTRLCWAQTPSARELLQVLAGRAAHAAAAGRTLQVEIGPPGLERLLEVTGLGPSGPIVMDDV